MGAITCLYLHYNLCSASSRALTFSAMAATAVHPSSPMPSLHSSPYLQRTATPLSRSSVCTPQLLKSPIPNDPPRRAGKARRFNVPASLGTASKTQPSTEPDHPSHRDKSNNKRKKTVKAKDDKKVDADDAKGKKRAKKIADPNMPKRPATAFFFFMSSFKDEFKKENPDSKGAALVAKAGGAKWKSMSSDEKLPFMKRATEEKAAYDVKIKLYKSHCSSLSTDQTSEGSGSSTAPSNDSSASAQEIVADNMIC